jgi:hypothetical protein
MALTLNGNNNTIGGVAVGGLPDGIVDTDMLAAGAVTAPKKGAGSILQVVSSVLDPGANNYASTSNTPANSGLITTVTPLAANSKFIIYQGGNALHLNESVSNRGIKLYIYASVAGGSYANVASDHIMSSHVFTTTTIDFPYSHMFHATVSYSLGQTVAFQPYYLRGTNSGNGSQQTYYWHHQGGSGEDTRIQQIVMEVAT